MSFDFLEHSERVAFAFRGYNTKNLGRSRELLEHSIYGAIVAARLDEASRMLGDIAGKRVDLTGRVRRGEESTLATFGEDIGLIVAMELAQLDCLERFFDFPYSKAQLAFGYSLGEITALAKSDVFRVEQLLPPLVALAPECAELANEATMGIVFSRGPELDWEAVTRLTLQITSEGRGMLAISSQLSPNTILMLGEGDTLDRFRGRMREILPPGTQLRKQGEKWPPLHTPLLWRRNIPNRAAVMSQAIEGGFVAPRVPIVSLVTGEVSYNDYNSRELLNRWIDHPQLLWDAISHVLANGIDTVIHVGPDPNLIPATFKRLSDNVRSQLSGNSFNSLGMRAMSRIASRAWLAKLLTARAQLLRAPFVKQVILEDWLLENTPA